MKYFYDTISMISIIKDFLSVRGVFYHSNGEFFYETNDAIFNITYPYKSIEKKGNESVGDIIIDVCK